MPAKYEVGENQRIEEAGFAMNRKRLSVEQIVGILKRAEVGAPVAI
jgi:hypothetical protein